MFKLREYQQECVDKIYDEFRKGVKRTVAVLPTGAGKSLIVSQLISDMVKWGKRVIMITHQKELIEQNHSKIDVDCPVTIYSASVGEKDLTGQVVLCGIQSIARVLDKMPEFDVVLVDETHQISMREDSMYQKFFSKLPNARVVGLTATPYRLDCGFIYGDGKFFETVAYDLPITYMFENKYLTPVISKAGVKKIDLTNVAVVGGEFKESDLQKACGDEELLDDVVRELLEYGADRKSWLVFASGVDNAYKIKDKLPKDISAEVVTGETKKEDRERILSDFKDGSIRCVINCSVLTTGFDAPNIDLVAMVRATGSASLLVQCCGRGLRLHDDKKDCLILDYGDNFKRHGLLDCIEPVRKKGTSPKKQEAPVRECPKCHEMLPIQKRECLCGYVFVTERLDKYNDKAYDGALLSTEVKIVESKIALVTFSRHKKKLGKHSLKMSMVLAGTFEVIDMFICIEHDGYARDKAVKILSQMGIENCNTVSDFLIDRQRQVIKPKAVRYKPAINKSSYPQIVRLIF